MIQHLDRTLFVDYRLPVSSQAVYRIAFAGFLVTNDTLACMIPVDAIPKEMWDPPYGMHLLGSPPSAGGLGNVSLALSAASTLLLLGIATPLASMATALLLFYTRAVTYSLGKVDHDILFVLTPLCLAFSRWGADCSIDALLRKPPSVTSDRDAWPFGLLAILVAFGYCTAGIQKILGGWLIPSFPAAFGWVILYGEHLQTNSVAFRYATALVRLPRLALESLDWLTLAFDFAFLWALAAGRRAFQAVLLIAVIFHWGTSLLYKIYFWHYLLVYVAFCDLVLGCTAALGSAATHKMLSVLRSPASIVAIAAAAFAVRKVGLVQFLPHALALAACLTLVALAFPRWKILRCFFRQSVDRVTGAG